MICLSAVVNTKSKPAHLHSLFSSEGVDLGLRSGRHSSVLDVEADISLDSRSTRSGSLLLLELDQRLRVPINVVEASTEVGHSVTTTA